MQIAILGFPRSGKTTVFNALTRGDAPTGEFVARGELNVGAATVPDSRVDRLAEMLSPRRPVHPDVTYVDLPGAPPGSPEDRIFSGEALTHIQQTDALLGVVRAFEDDSVPHPRGSLDWRRDVTDLGFETLFADIALIDRRIERIEAALRGLRAAEREARASEVEALRSVQSNLEGGTPLRGLELNETARRALQDTFLLSALPYMVALNIGEADLPRSADLQRELDGMTAGPGAGGRAVCAGLEMELAQMPPEDEKEFRESLGAGEPVAARMAGLSYEVLGLVSFLTIGDDEVRAWPVQAGTPAVRAAGKVHSDMERGFIRAEVVPYDELIAAGGMQEARKAGLVRSEGREYPMQDGDVVNFLFSV